MIHNAISVYCNKHARENVFSLFCFFFFLVSLTCILFESADDMGLGKTLTMISLILAMKRKAKEEDGKKEEEKLERWLSKTGN